MPADVFISYVREDRDYADAIAIALKAEGVSVWWDADLLPGLSFETQIFEELRKAPIVAAVLSPKSVQSPWVGAEISHATGDRLVIVPILVGGLQPEQMPPFLKSIQALVFDDLSSKQAASEIARRIKALLRQIPRGEIVGDGGRRLAQASAETARAASTFEAETESAGAPDSIFVVHGHDEDMRNAVTSELERWGIKPVVLQRVRTSDDHLFAKFKAVAAKARHAIVLLSGDDVGAAFRESPIPLAAPGGSSSGPGRT